MFSTAKKIIKDWFTGIDGVTYDPARFLWIAGMVAFLIFTGHMIYKGNKDFDMVNFGLAYGSLLAAGAAGVKIKETTEPTALAPPAAPPTPPTPPQQSVTVTVQQTDNDPSIPKS